MTDDATPIAPRSMPSSADERYLRRLLAYRVAMPGAYYDDGEAQGHEHGIAIDFMREPVADIDAKLRALNVARHYAAEAAEKDAARYRYVRSVRPDALLNVAWSMSSEACKIGADADAAIDAAIAAT